MSTDEIIAELPRLSVEELARVQAKLKELAKPAAAPPQADSIATHPALGVWKARTDLPDDSVEASHVLRERMLRRDDSAQP